MRVRQVIRNLISHLFFLNLSTQKNIADLLTKGLMGQ